MNSELPKCTIAVVACCLPGSDELVMQFTCFEFHECPGRFFDEAPCKPEAVVYAATLLLEYYKSLHNITSVAIDVANHDEWLGWIRSGQIRLC